MQGGLVLIGMAEARNVTDHKPNCGCEQCVVAWETRMQESLRLSARRATALEGELVSGDEERGGAAAAKWRGSEDSRSED